MSRKRIAAISTAATGAAILALGTFAFDDDRARRRWESMPESKRRRLSQRSGS